MALDDSAAVCGQLHALECATRAQLLREIHRLQLSGEWSADGAATLANWLTMRLGYSLAEARELVRVADSVAFLPACLELFGSGRLSWSRLVEVTRFARPDTDHHWAINAPSMSVGELKSLAREVRDNHRRDAEAAFDQRYVKINFDAHHYFVEAVLPLADGAVVAKALDRVADGYGIDPETGIWPTRRAALADALVEVCSRRLGADDDADRATVLVEVDAVALNDGPGHLDGKVIANETVRRLACDARLQVATVDEAGKTIGIGRVSRTIPPWMNRLLTRRDRGCRFPGCHHERWVHGHHIKFWSDDGPTDMGNLITLCSKHHHFVHEKKWTIEGDPDANVVFVRPDGQRFDGRPPSLGDQARLWLEDVLQPLVTTT